MFNLRSFVGKEIIWRQAPYSGAIKRGILLGFDKECIYVSLAHTVKVKWRLVDGKNVRLPFIVDDRIIQKQVVFRNGLILINLAEEEEWHNEEFALDNPYPLDKWLSRHKRSRIAEAKKPKPSGLARLKHYLSHRLFILRLRLAYGRWSPRSPGWRSFWLGSLA